MISLEMVAHPVETALFVVALEIPYLAYLVAARTNSVIHLEWELQVEIAVH